MRKRRFFKNFGKVHKPVPEKCPEVIECEVSCRGQKEVLRFATDKRFIRLGQDRKGWYLLASSFRDMRRPVKVRPILHSKSVVIAC